MARQHLDFIKPSALAPPELDIQDITREDSKNLRENFRQWSDVSPAAGAPSFIVIAIRVAPIPASLRSAETSKSFPPPAFSTCLARRYRQQGDRYQSKHLSAANRHLLLENLNYSVYIRQLSGIYDDNSVKSSVIVTSLPL